MKQLTAEIAKLRYEISIGKADQALFTLAVLMERMASRLEVLEKRK